MSAESPFRVSRASGPRQTHVKHRFSVCQGRPHDGGLLQVDSRILRADVVDEGREAVGDGGICDLEHVLGV